MRLHKLTDDSPCLNKDLHYITLHPFSDTRQYPARATFEPDVT